MNLRSKLIFSGFIVFMLSVSGCQAGIRFIAAYYDEEEFEADNVIVIIEYEDEYEILPVDSDDNVGAGEIIKVRNSHETGEEKANSGSSLRNSFGRNANSNPTAKHGERSSDRHERKTRG